MILVVSDVLGERDMRQRIYTECRELDVYLDIEVMYVP